MLKENLTKLGEKEDSYHYRRWFSDDEFHLTLDYDTNSVLLLLTLTYDYQGQAKVLRWSPSHPPHHHRLDPGEDNPARNQSPLVMEKTEPDPVYKKRFLASSGDIPEEIRDLVLQLWD